MDDDKVLEALNTIQEYCKQFPDCNNCKFQDLGGECLIREASPSEWEINNEKIIKYLL